MHTFGNNMTDQIKGYHISLDPLFEIDSIFHEKIIDKWVSEIPYDPNETTLLLSLWHEYFSEIIPIFNYIKRFNFKKIYVTRDILQFKFLEFLNHDPTFTVVPINFFAIFVNNRSILNHPWTPTLDRALLLTGKLAKDSRIGVLKKLYDKKLLNEKVLWTVPNFNKQKSSIVDYFSQLVPSDIEKFLVYCNDHAEPSEESSLGVHPTVKLNAPSYCIKENLNSISPCYAKTSFSIISESWFDDPEIYWISEKTYRAILHRHPFIVASAVGHLKFLKSLGFRTFENYLPIPDYDSIIDNNDRMDAVVANVEAFYTIIQNHQDEISQDVEYNYQILKQSVNSDVEKLKDLYNFLGLSFNNYMDTFRINVGAYKSIEDREYFVTTLPNEIATTEFKDEIITNRWLEQYNRVRGIDWPNLNHYREFYNLPNWIKEEWDNFGLAPPDERLFYNRNLIK